MAGKRTMRRTTCKYNTIPVDMEFSDVERHNLRHDDGSLEVAVSTVDFLFKDCDAFILNGIPNRFTYGVNCRNGNLNKHGLWETVIDELERTCISKNVRSHKYHEKCETVYKVPVVGHKIFLPPPDDDYELGMYHELRDESEDSEAYGKLPKSALLKIKRNPAQYLYWDGKYYDATKVYIFKPELSNYLQVIGDVLAPRAADIQNKAMETTAAHCGPIVTTTHKNHHSVEFIKSISYHNAQHKRVRQGCRIFHEGQSQCNNQNNYYGASRMGGWEQLYPHDYLEINLGYPRSVTHIGTAGEFPETSVFPSRATVGRTRIKKFRAEEENLDMHVLSQNGNGVKVRKFAPHVRILKEDEHALCWVTSYEVHYRHTVTNKWTLLAVVPANCDAFTEHILDLSPYFNVKDGLFTQYLRIRPVEYHNKPRMRVSVYGVDKIVGEQKIPSNLTEGQTSTNSSEEVPTITYAITDSTPLNAARYVRDGLRSYYYVDEWHLGHYLKDRALKRRDFRKMLVQQEKTGDV